MNDSFIDKLAHCGARGHPPPPSAGMTRENQGTWDRSEWHVIISLFLVRVSNCKIKLRISLEWRVTSGCISVANKTMATDSFTNSDYNAIICNAFAQDSLFFKWGRAEDFLNPPLAPVQPCTGETLEDVYRGCVLKLNFFVSLFPAPSQLHANVSRRPRLGPLV